jgi:NAD(P)-dependent dehydrogenase (short-subunit alcohol dehydrogenase family)
VLFKRTIEHFGTVDVVVSEQAFLSRCTHSKSTPPLQITCAGIGEGAPNILGESTTAEGDPSPPQLQTLSVNLTGTVYSTFTPTGFVGRAKSHIQHGCTATHLALHYMKQTQHVTPGFAKTLVLIASMAALYPPSLMPLYAASKAGVVGTCRALYRWYAQLGIKVVAALPVYVGKSAADPGPRP